MTDDNLISTKDRPGVYDGLETAKPGEPVFVIQGGDPSGPATVLFWAKSARQRGMDETDSKAAADVGQGRPTRIRGRLLRPVRPRAAAVTARPVAKGRSGASPTQK